MTMFQVQSRLTNSSHQDEQRENDSDCEYENIKTTQEIPAKIVRPLTISEEVIINTINNCFQNWYEPWKKTYLLGGEEFNAIHDLMENLMHYEYQIINNDKALSSDRTFAISQAVARLIDYGNAILNLDLIIRADDETSKELDSSNVTTVELYHAHVKAQKLRDKLLYNYFKRDKRNFVTPTLDTEVPNHSPSSSLPIIASTTSLQVPPSYSNNPVPITNGSQHRLSVGSNLTINTLTGGDSGRRTPIQSIEVKTISNDQELTKSQLELKQMIATIKSSSFSDPNSIVSRRTLLPGVLNKIESLLTVPTNAEKLNSCFDLLDALLISIERLPPEYRKEEVRIISTSLLKSIVRKVYSINTEKLVELQHSRWTTHLLSIIRLMTTADFNAYLKHFTNLTDLSTFLKDYLFIIKRLVTSNGRLARGNHTMPMLHTDPQDFIYGSKPIYPDCWVEMTLLVCSTFLNSMIGLYQTLRQNFASNLQMWLSYIESLVYFMLQNTLRPGRSMFKERQKLLANDLRKTSAEYVWITWDSLSYDQKQSTLEDLIEPLLRACMVLDSRQRAILLPIFHDMMRCDYNCQYVTPQGSVCNSSPGLSYNRSTTSRLDLQMNYLNEEDFQQNNGPQLKGASGLNQKLSGSRESLPYLSLLENASDDGTVLTRFTHLVVEKLNNLIVEHELGDLRFKIEFCAALLGELNPKYYYNQNSLLNTADLGQFKYMARHTSDIIAEFIQITLDSREANRLSYNHLYLLCLFKLILFFRDKVCLIELYLTYLHKLWTLHHNTGRYIEAGFTLLEHAKTLPWSNEPIESHHRIVTRSFHSTEPITDYSSLKIFLYTTIIEYFEQGQLWEAAVPLCRKLAEIYQFKTFDYEKLSQVLAKLSSYFANIASGSLRSYSEYFRVAFYGNGYPDSLRNSTMIYRGKPFEKLGDFQRTILNKYPDAKLLTTLGQPDEELLNESDSKYLQINACSPIVDLKSRLGKTADPSQIDTNILDYYKHNECDRFEFSRRITGPASLSSSGSPSSKGPNEESKTIVTTNGEDEFANIWRERTTLTTNTLPGMLPFFPVYLAETSIVSPIECAIEDLERANDRLSCMVNRFKADKRQEADIRPLGQLLLGIVDAAVNGGITKYEQAFLDAQQMGSPSSFTLSDNMNTNSKQQQQTANMAHHTTTGPGSTSTTAANYNSPSVSGTTTNQAKTNNLIQHEPPQPQLLLVDRCQQADSIDYVGASANHNKHHQPNPTQVNKLKCLIAEQVPLLDQAIRLHRDRVADVMRPQHEHLEASYKKLKHHIMSKYSRHLPADYQRNSYSSSTLTIRSHRSRARSPNCSNRSSAWAGSDLSTSRSSPVSQQAQTMASCSPSMGSSVTNSFYVACPPITIQAQHQPTPPSLMNSKASGVLSSERGKRMSDTPGIETVTTQANRSPPTGKTTSNGPNSSDIPYHQLGQERRSLPFLTGVPDLDRVLIREATAASAYTTTSLHRPGRSFRGPPPPPPRPKIDSVLVKERKQSTIVNDYLNTPPPPPPPPPRSRLYSVNSTPTAVFDFNDTSYVSLSDLIDSPACVKPETNALGCHGTRQLSNGATNNPSETSNESSDQSTLIEPLRTEGSVLNPLCEEDANLVSI